MGPRISKVYVGRTKWISYTCVDFTRVKGDHDTKKKLRTHKLTLKSMFCTKYYSWLIKRKRLEKTYITRHRSTKSKKKFALSVVVALYFVIYWEKSRCFRHVNYLISLESDISPQREIYTVLWSCTWTNQPWLSSPLLFCSLFHYSEGVSFRCEFCPCCISIK